MDKNYKYGVLENEYTVNAGVKKEVLVEGTLIEVLESSNLKTKFKVVDYCNRESDFKSDVFECNSWIVRRVHDCQWPYIIAICDPTERLNLIKNNERVKFILNTNISDMVLVNGGPFGLTFNYPCVVKSIGCVTEMGPGYYFGLQILNLEYGTSPQAENIPYAKDYLGIDPKLCFIVSANFLLKLENETKKKGSPIEIIASAFNILKETTLKKSNTHNSIENCPAFDVSNYPQMDRKPKGGKPFVSSKNNAEEGCIKKSDQRVKVETGTIPKQIIKHKFTNEISSSGNVKPSTIMSTEDVDIIVIDNLDIDESIKNTSDVIVVSPRQKNNVDLLEFLKGTWPEQAGEIAQVLNTDVNNVSRTSSIVKNERNKSGNPLNHIGGVDKKNCKDISGNIQQELTKMDNAIGGSRTKETVIAGARAKERKLKNVTSDEPIYNNTIVKNNKIVNLATPEEEFIPPSPLLDLPGTKLEIGSMVQITTDVCDILPGVIRWMGIPQNSKNIRVGVEIDECPIDKPLDLTDGTHNGIRYFSCPEGRALFVDPDQCSLDSRFEDIDVTSSKGIASGTTMKMSDTFGHVECPIVKGSVAPIKTSHLESLNKICGKFKGIQGHHNSCYLDATLFAMFTFTSVFDSLLFRPQEPKDISNYLEVQSVLREEIVNPLRKNVFVRADRVMKLRQLLEKLSSVTGLTSEEKDPEEFLNSLLAQIMHAEPFLKFNSGQDAFYYQLFVEKDEKLSFPSVQQLFEQSFFASDIKLKEVPSCLIIQMPRFGKNYKMYPRILPSQVLDVTDIIDNSPRQCSVCGGLAEYECRQCIGNVIMENDSEFTSFCKVCWDQFHQHPKRTKHTRKQLSVPQEFKLMAEHTQVPRIFMELFAVVCIETSHYVAFVKAGSGLDSPWCFFDSMADREGEINGYNIPELITVPDLPEWLSENGSKQLHETTGNDKLLPEHAKRLMCDAYMCMYQSTDVMMYR